MRKLEDIPKKQVFQTPEGYFDQLPTKIQKRIAEDSRRSSSMSFISYSLKYALPVLALVIAGILYFRPEPSIESQLNDIDSEQIALYLQNAEHPDPEDLPDPDGLTTNELNQLEDEVYSNMEYSNEELIDELDLDNL
jgi:RNase adaptor protein for sRNA GlmZ degradation